MSDASRRPAAALCAASFAVMFLVACDSTNDRDDADGLHLATPDRVRNIEAINPAAVSAVATVNGVDVVLSPSANGTFTGNVAVPANSVVPVSIEFAEQVNGQSLVLATQSQQVSTGASDNQVIVRRAAYNFDEHDADGDSVSNIVEREENTNPLDPNDAPPMVNVNVVADLPAGIGNNSANNYKVEAAVGSSIRFLQRSGNQFQGTFYTPERTPVTVSANYVESVTGQQLEIASQSYELSEIFDQQTITFSENGYALTDRDGDGQTDLTEVIAGTSIFENANNTATSEFSFASTFNVPSAIQNAGSIYAEYRVDGALISLTRNANTYSADTVVEAGAIVVLDVLLQDNFNGSAYTVASAQKTVPVSSDGQVVQFSESEFTLQFDTDEDGVLNYVERVQATNPLVADSLPPEGGGVTCNVSDIPAQVVAAGATVSQSIIGFVNCGGAPFELAATEYQFNWNSADNSIQWTVPSSATPDTQLPFTVDVRNPANVSEIYAGFQVNTTVAPATDSCDATPSLQSFTVDKDLHVQGSDVINDVQLRVDAINRETLLGFSVPASTALTGNGTLTLTVGNDEGDGTIAVSQPDSFPWSESDDEVQVPQAATIGSLSNSWLSGQQYQFNLSGLRQDASGLITLVLTQTTGNDVAFLARENGNGAVLSVEVAADCSNQ